MTSTMDGGSEQTIKVDVETEHIQNDHTNTRRNRNGQTIQTSKRGRANILYINNWPTDKQTQAVIKAHYHIFRAIYSQYIIPFFLSFQQIMLFVIHHFALLFHIIPPVCSCVVLLSPDICLLLTMLCYKCDAMCPNMALFH